MGTADKNLARMRQNPRDWRIEDLKAIADRLGIAYRQQGTSHVTFRHPSSAKVTVPAHRPILPISIKLFLAMIDAVKEGE
ncbi:MAG: type II toxin-antitoxin system HicA family toxin [Desulfovibrionaceae bacterium]|nr:type II toxin-antitoxin system HicA family toxin [Desulfovibrionaceae bacterium]